MSSLSKNVLPRREHRERAQPSGRVSKHGLLEKKKDYKLRAKDANRKARRLQLLREKAAFRNPDEFYHAMERAAPTKNGRVRRARDPNAADNHHTADGAVRRLVETQDRAYVRVKSARERANIDALKNSLHFLAVAAADQTRKHTVFVDDDDVDTGRNQDEYADDSNDEDDDDDDSGPRIVREPGTGAVQLFNRELHFNAERARLAARLRTDDVDGSVDLDDAAAMAAAAGIRPLATHDARITRKAKKKSQKAYLELEQRISRASRLNMAMEDLTLRQKLLGKGARTKVKVGNAQAGVLPVFKWKKERKR
jgi:U3 small nucleolar RNA-associated protein 11